MLRTVTLALLALLLSASSASAQEPTPLPAPPGSEAEPNQTPGTATPIEAGERIRALSPTGDVDHYRFTADAGDRVFATVITAASPQGDSRLALIGTDGQTVIEADNDDGTLQVNSSSIAGATIPTAGTYYLRVDAPVATTQLMPYDLLLDVQTGDPKPEVEPNGTTPQPLGGDRFVSGTTAVDDHDFFGLELGAGDTVFLSLDLDPERDGETFNGRVAFGNETLLVANNGPTDANPSEAFVSTVAVDGVYNLVVDAVTGSGTYQLSITVIRAVERGCRTYTITPSPGALPDRDAVTFPIDVPDAGTVDHAALRLDVNHTFMSDLDVTLEAPAGNQALIFDDIGNQSLGSPNTRMLTLFDDHAGTPAMFTWLKGMGHQSERSGLSYFVGQQGAGTWKLTFRDDAVSDVGELTRADLILCIRPAEEGPVDTVFSAGFESGDDGFSHTGTADEWEQGTPATPAAGHLAGLASCAEGASCFKTDLDGTYEPGSSQDLVSPPISLAGRTGQISASWEMWYQLEGVRFDHFAVSVEEDGGADARPLFTWTGNDMEASVGNPLVQLGLSAGWGRHRADVSDYAGRTIRLRFHLDSDLSVQRRGVAIDDVRVYQSRAVAPVDDAPPASPPADEVAPATVAEEAPAISDLRLGSRCVRRSSTGRVRVPMTMTLSQPGAVRVRVDRAIGSRGRSSCPRANPKRNQRFRRVATFRPVAKVRAAAVPKQVTLDLRLRPGLYRLTVRVQLEDGTLSPPARQFLRVVS